MRIGLVVAGGFDPSGRERVIPSLVWLVERLARRHAVHVFVLRYFEEPRTYALALGLCVLAIIVIGTLSAPWLAWATQAASSLF